MREVKFRAWYEKEKRFLSWDELQDGTESLQTYFNNELSDVSPLMQYTCFKDENEREIYEGDIVRHATDEGVYKVIFEDGGFYVKSLIEYDFQKINEYPLEIIGNIYENPELLEGEE